jgi:ubiquinone/menaquinone biosynthesis C-methylase UbiE
MSSLDFTGERFVPDAGVSNRLYCEHLSRYHYALPFCRGKRILDLGCGTGYGTHILSKSAKEIIGVDIAKEAVDYAKKNYANSNLRYGQMDAIQIDFEDNSFDTVVSFELFEHVHDQEMLLRQAKRVLSDDGKLIISTPDKERYNASLSNPNKFHICEVSEEEFRHVLSRFFVTVDLFWQNPNPVAWSLLEYEYQLTMLRQRVRELELSRWIPFYPYIYKCSPPFIKHKLHNMIKRIMEKNKAGLKYPYRLHINDFTFDPLPHEYAVYMLAVCADSA